MVRFQTPYLLRGFLDFQNAKFLPLLLIKLYSFLSLWLKKWLWQFVVAVVPSTVTHRVKVWKPQMTFKVYYRAVVLTVSFSRSRYSGFIRFLCHI